MPRSVRARAREIERANSKLEHQLQRAPTDEEMSNELGITIEEFHESLLQISNSTVAALDELWTVSDSSGDQVSLLDTIQDPGAPDPAAVMDATDLKDRVADAIARLPEREKLVVALYYYENSDAARDRRGPRGHRVAHQPAAHEGRAAAALPIDRRRLALLRLQRDRPPDGRGRRPGAPAGEGQHEREAVLALEQPGRSPADGQLILAVAPAFSVNARLPRPRPWRCEGQTRWLVPDRALRALTGARRREFVVSDLPLSTALPDRPNVTLAGAGGGGGGGGGGGHPSSSG